MEYPIESTLSQPQSYYANSMDQEYHSNDAGIDLNALGSINAMDLETDSDMYNKIMASTPTSVPLSNETLGDTLHLNDEIFFENQANGDYKYNFTQPSGSPSTSSSTSSIPLSNATLGTPDLSVPDKVATFPPTPQLNYNDNFFQNQLSTPQINQLPDQNRHNSTSIPVDQLNLLSIKSLGTNPTLVPNYYYTTNNSRTDENEFNYNFNLALDNLNKDAASFEPNSQPIEQKEPGTSSISASSESINGRGRDSERTINPRKLFTSSNKILTSMSSPALTTLFAINNSSLPSSSTANATQQYKDTPSSMPVPKIPSLPNQSSPASLPLSNGVNLNNLLSKNQYRTPKFDFKMNDECYNAISYWLNNTLQTVRSEDDLESSDPTNNDDATKIMVNPTGIIKGNYQSFSNTTSTPTVRNRPHSFSSHGSYGGVSKRRNSLQMSSPSVTSQQAIISDLENRQVNEDIDNNEFATSPSSSMVPPSKSYVLPAGQKKNTKRRKSSNTYESPSKLASDFSKLEASMNYAPSIQFEDSRRKSGSSPTNVEFEDHNQDKNKINDVPTVPSSSSTVAQNSQGAFLCTECDKQFKRSEHLKRHVRSVHSNIRPFLCKYCDKKFSRSDNLAQHLKTHYRVDSSGQTTILNASSSNRVGSSGGRGRKD